MTFYLICDFAEMYFTNIYYCYDNCGAQTCSGWWHLQLMPHFYVVVFFFFYWNLSGLNAETHTAYDWYTVIIIGEQSVLTVHLETISSCSVF